jgi:hypothetical protein
MQISMVSIAASQACKMEIGRAQKQADSNGSHSLKILMLFPLHRWYNFGASGAG